MCVQWQAVVCNQLAKIEREQRAIVEQLTFLKKERCALYPLYHAHRQLCVVHVPCLYQSSNDANGCKPPNC